MLNYVFLSTTNTLVKDTRMTSYAIIAVSPLPPFITINTDNKTYKVAPSFAHLSTYPNGVTVSFRIEDRTPGAYYLRQSVSYSVTFKIVNNQPVFSTFQNNLKICHTIPKTLDMPTATD